jgi:hypothetical protein
MSAPTSFHFFTRLPQELQDTIWKIHYDSTAIRHYFERLDEWWRVEVVYAAIDTKVNLFANTALTKQETTTYEEQGQPVHGSTVAQVQLEWYATYPRPGTEATSITTSTTDRSTWLYTKQPYVRIDFGKDVVFLQNGLQYFFLYDDWPDTWASAGDWLHNVRFLAIGVEREWEDRDDTELIASLRNLEKLYLVLVPYYEPLSPGLVKPSPPREWKDYNNSILNNHSFIPEEEYFKIHPDGPADRDSQVAYSHERLAAFREAFRQRGRDVEVSIVADPY